MNRPKPVDDVLEVSSYITQLETDKVELESKVWVANNMLLNLVTLVKGLDLSREFVDELNVIVPDAFKMRYSQWWHSKTHDERDELITKWKDVVGDIKRDDDFQFAMYKKVVLKK